MPSEESTSRKAKKAQRDAERKKGGKKRKHGNDVEESNADAPGELENDFIPLAGGDESTVAKASTSLSRKRQAADSAPNEQEAASEKSSAPKAKKRRKTKAAGNPETDDGAANVESAPEVAGDATTALTKPSKSRFILFIGNLPYTATDASITAHFKSIQPFTLRHRTDPKTQKSKGFAFLEFENYDRMKTCLKLYHHSTFDPAAAPASTETADAGAKGRRTKDRSRRINVELTAGGGGKGEERKEKIKVKNAKLEEERQRRREAEEKEALKKAKKQGPKKTAANAVGGKKESRDVAGEGKEEQMQGIHPARLARIKG